MSCTHTAAETGSQTLDLSNTDLPGFNTVTDNGDIPARIGMGLQISVDMMSAIGSRFARMMWAMPPKPETYRWRLSGTLVDSD